ncbi:hypothetical protein PVA44_05595 [Entomospira nematocerorum]|uniref:Right handed beta helix domain-containing protein n=1 Tax=Entomospira nematocerorum TaxID=2719987 RepID=A0A968GAW4_9SPIO|nr:hypothetical protein [Entomospira nematocera]NIZ46507.1 hypothetical protein [Entomospira nematocera]WDI33692.1 hypothetical protein PVA44_05595 [Entomospira nematocera]
MKLISHRLIYLLMLMVSMGCSDRNVDSPRGDITSDQIWFYRAFGQSTDVFFDNIANAPGQNGINHVWINPIWAYNDPLYIQSEHDINQSLLPDIGIHIHANDTIVVESRGGKIAAGHDGMTFFYTEIPADRNFQLRATMTITAAGPHPDNKGSKGKVVTSFQQQSGGGIMARDVISQHRKELAIDGFEELPSVSNFSATGFLGGKIDNNGQRFVNAGTLYRDGQTSIQGNVGVGREGVQDALLEVGLPYVYILERTDEGYFSMILSADESEIIVSRTSAGNPDLTNRIDHSHIYVGVGMMREVRVVVEQLQLKDHGIHRGTTTMPPSYQSESTLRIKSHNYTTSSEYTLALMSNRDGIVIIHQLDTDDIRAEIQSIEELYIPLILNKKTNKITIKFIDNEEKKQEYQLSVIYDEGGIVANQPLYVSPDGSGTGTMDNPASIVDAIQWLQPGQTLYLLDGRYTIPIIIDESNGGLPSYYKTIKPLPGANVWINTHILIQGNYWYINNLLVGGTEDERIDVSGKGTLGNAVINILGSYNIIERVITEYGTGTGLNIGNSGIYKEFFPKYNHILKSESRYNVDLAGNNADGFGAKRVGPGNYFYQSIAHNNVDDGWDLFNPIDAGASDPVLIEESIAYSNAHNGFKIGGEGQPAHHIVRNSLAFQNGMAGFSDNFNPGELILEFNTSADNADQNFLMRDNSIFPPQNQLHGVLSWRKDLSHAKEDYISGSISESALFKNGSILFNQYSITKDDFMSVTPPLYYQRDKNGFIIWGDYMRVRPDSPLRKYIDIDSSLGVKHLYK